MSHSFGISTNSSFAKLFYLPSTQVTSEINSLSGMQYPPCKVGSRLRTFHKLSVVERYQADIESPIPLKPKKEAYASFLIQN